MQPLYGTIARRLNGLLLDWLVVLGILGAFTTLGTAFDGSPNVRAALFVAMLSAVLLYEPVLVSRYGATLGHRWQNLRVIADRGGFPSFPQALLRLIAKVPLGIFSLFSVPATERHQAVHDLIARTTVQIHDPSQGPSHTYAVARAAASGVLPSLGRRLLVTASYEAGLFLMLNGTLFFSSSDACLLYDDCTAGEISLFRALGILWLALAVLFGAFGMTGRLWGARRKAAGSDLR